MHVSWYTGASAGCAASAVVACAASHASCFKCIFHIAGCIASDAAAVTAVVEDISGNCLGSR